jgi:16S rRNA (adenine1518-N6/adenine1519-N6)-dimethyltransferase
MQKNSPIMINKHKARKRFGQNFLTDNTIIERIIKTIAPKATDNLLEIGPGQGAITLPLLQYLKTLHAIEIDRDLIARLKTLGKKNLIIHESDALKFDLSTLPNPLRIVGNLPYNISSPLLFHFLNNTDKIIDMTFMLQKEVVERMVADSGSKIYGRLSVMMQAFFELELVFIVPPESFEPAPKVDSAIVYLKPLKQPKTQNLAMFEKIVKAAFSKRRKTLRNCLKGLLTQAQTQVDLSLRAEALQVEDFALLSRDYQKTL